MMVIAKAEVSSRKAVRAQGDAPRLEQPTKQRRRKAVKTAVAKLLLLGAIAAVDSTADPGMADSVLGDGPAIVCYITGPARASP